MTDDRPTDHTGMAVLSRDDCLALLAKASLGRLAFVSAGEPVILPVNHAVDGSSVVFRTAPGSKLFAADRETPVAFEVDGHDAEGRRGWSVVVRGVAGHVTDAEVIDRLETLGVRSWAARSQKPHWVRIRTYEITGREIAADLPEA